MTNFNSKLVISDAFKTIVKIDFEKSASQVFRSGSCGQIISGSLDFDSYKKYIISNSITDNKKSKTQAFSFGPRVEGESRFYSLLASENENRSLLVTPYFTIQLFD